ncbi:hypothetical protein UB46_28320 [Burkholderiaceae bacterium 16]|nr:hypothetical protein UB46_28320 [Burkholderiaceae bacterium 16]
MRPANIAMPLLDRNSNNKSVSAIGRIPARPLIGHLRGILRYLQRERPSDIAYWQCGELAILAAASCHEDLEWRQRALLRRDQEAARRLWTLSI